MPLVDDLTRSKLTNEKSRSLKYLGIRGWLDSGFMHHQRNYHLDEISHQKLKGDNDSSTPGRGFSALSRYV